MPTSDIIKLANVRLSFPRLFRPRAFQPGQDPRFEATFLLDPSDKAHAASIKEIQDTAQAILEEHFNGKVPKGVVMCFGDADEDDKEYDGYQGMFYISTSNKTKPTIVGRKLEELDEQSGVPYAGCYVNTNLTLWVMDNQFGKRVNANLRIVQFVRDGEAFGVRPADAAEEFEVLDDDDFEEGGDDDFLD